MSLLTDMFYRQIEQTKLICAYIQLKPTSSAAMVKLTKDVIATLEVRDARASLYDVFFFDTGLVFKLVASTFVYITVQLQLAFPNLEDGHKVENITKPAEFVLNQNAVKEFMFLY
ncbi:uncharacterized protein LOC142974168 [Anticarsia gemmatalis]|uniref:uncharacterized protein LOC142974168 n=1 Tax=Anticarsia gemmatalis TaxID=129554 RepID=UPI003F7629F6